MKKSLLTIGLIALSLSVQAQNNVLLHVDDTAKMYVSNGTLVYNGGGLQTKGSGNIDLYGNMMVVGTSTDGLKTLNATGGGDKLDGGNINVKLVDAANPVTSPYGQLYISGIPQNNITAIVNKEYASTKHGDYQQIAIPFKGKTISSFNTEAGTSAFSETRWTKKEILKWSNANLRFDGNIIPYSTITSATQPGIAYQMSYTTSDADKTGYFSVGTLGFNPSTMHTFKGTPFADGSTSFTLAPAATSPNFGASGSGINIYRERYNTYIWDDFEPSTSAWVGASWGKNIYQFSNPYFTNLDLSLVGYDEPSGVTDGNNISNIYGIAVNPSNVVYNSGTTSSYATGQMVTFDPTTKKPNGNYDALIIKPLGTFKIKLRTNASQTLGFDNLRRFNTTPRAEATAYSVSAAKNGNNIIKQLGVLALDANGNQIGETYYVVAPQFTSGHIADPIADNSVQAMTSTNAIIQTYEEALTGGTDANYSSAYRLYINEANETNFLGKRVDMGIFGSNVVSLKFQLRDDTQLVADGTHLLSAGKGFYYTKADGVAHQITQGTIIPVTEANLGLYYGEPQNVTLGTGESVAKKSRTLVTYNPDVTNYIVRFDPEWKSASISVFDASGKLVITEKSVKTDSDYVIKLDASQKAMYVVKVIGNDGTIVNSKILIK